ncbi:MAG: alpha/beta fold hydrolase, partial [Chthoniobacterales bacterium]
MKLLLSLSLILIVGYLLICAALYFNQDRLLFFPDHASAAQLESHARQIGFEPWTNAGGERIGWRSIAGDPANPLLICQGNGGLALSNDYATMRQTTPFQFFLLEYPGYGARLGKPSAQSLTAAAVDAIDTLTAGNHLRRIWLLGQSLGSGIVSAAAAARPDKIKGLVLLTPFDSLSAAAGNDTVIPPRHAKRLYDGYAGPKKFWLVPD